MNLTELHQVISDLKLPGKRHMHMTHVVPQSSDPTNLSCLNELGMVETDEAVD